MARFHVDLQMRWADQDAYRHINNVAQARYFEEARVRTFFSGTTREDTKLSGLFREDTETGLKMVVASQTIDFIRPLQYTPQDFEVEMWIGKLGGSSIELYAQIINPEQGPLPVSTCKVISVVVDGQTMRPERLSEEGRAVAKHWMDEPLKVGR